MTIDSEIKIKFFDVPSEEISNMSATFLVASASIENSEKCYKGESNIVLPSCASLHSSILKNLALVAIKQLFENIEKEEENV